MIRSIVDYPSGRGAPTIRASPTRMSAMRRTVPAVPTAIAKPRLGRLHAGCERHRLGRRGGRRLGGARSTRFRPGAAEPLRRGQRRAPALLDRRPRRAGPAAARLRRDQPHVASADQGAGADAHRDRTRPARLRRVVEADRRLHEGDDGAGRPRADGEPRAAPQRGRRPRHRPDGRLRLCRAVPGRGRPHRADGRLPARRRQLEGRLAAARPLALPLLRQDAAGPRRRARADLLRALLERLRRRPEALDSRGRPPLLREGLCAARRDAGRLRGVPGLRAGCRRLRRATRRRRCRCRCSC